MKKCTVKAECEFGMDYTKLYFDVDFYVPDEVFPPKAICQWFANGGMNELGYGKMRNWKSCGIHTVEMDDIQARDDMMYCNRHQFDAGVDYVGEKVLHERLEQYERDIRC